MDRKQLCRLINNSLLDVPNPEIEIFFENENNIRIEVISDHFIGMNLTARIDYLSNKFINLITNESNNCHLIYNPLTKNEKYLKTSETISSDIHSHSDLNKIAYSQPIRSF